MGGGHGGAPSGGRINYDECCAFCSKLDGERHLVWFTFCKDHLACGEQTAGGQGGMHRTFLCGQSLTPSQPGKAFSSKRLTDPLMEYVSCFYFLSFGSRGPERPAAFLRISG